MIRRLWLLPVVLLLVFAFAACGNDDDENAPAPDDDSVEQRADRTETPTPEETPTSEPTATPEIDDSDATPDSSEDPAETTPDVETPEGDSRSEGQSRGSQATPRSTWRSEPTARPRSRSQQQPTPVPTPRDDATVVACNDILAPVDKQHRLPADCAPNGLLELPSSARMRDGQYMVGEAAHAFVAMVEDAAAAGHTILARSSYRSYETQVATYNSHVANQGQAQADRISARPGHSEHQLGTTVDVTTPEVNYQLSTALGDTAAGRWLAENAANYGFVMSYPPGKESVTGYSYEPWHYRYVGPDIAHEVRESGLTLGEYLLQR